MANVREECLAKYQELKASQKFSYVLLKLSADSTEILFEGGSSTGTYDDLLSKLPETECRYAILNCSYETADGGRRNKIVFITWVPNEAPMKAQLYYQANQDSLRSKLSGIDVDIKATQYPDVSYEVVLDKCRRTQ